MGLEQIQGFPEAIKALEANLSPRAKHLAELERYVDGTQYAGLPDWFSDEKTLWERAPCIVYPIVRSAIDSNVDLLLGEGRFPTANVEGLEGDDAEAFEKFVSLIVKQSRLKPAAREVFASGQGSGAACAIFGVRGGRLFVDTMRARWCEPKLDVEGAVLSIEIRYPYLTIEKIAGKQEVRAKLYRRVIDDKSDTTFLPGVAREDGAEPSWRPDPARTIDHAFGFCPVIWYPHMRGCAIEGDFDGNAIHEHLTDEIRAHDFALSQRHRAALYCGDPQWTEIGVQQGYNPTSTVRRVEMPASTKGGINEVHTGAYVSRPRNVRARKKSPGTVWQYDGDATKVKVELHTLPPDALEAVDKHARDIRVKLAESLGVVFLDPETMPQSTTLSGRALEALKARQLDRCDNYRSDVGDRFLLPGLGMLIRIALVKKLKLTGIEVVRKLVDAANDQWSWRAPSIELTWGRYFRLDSEEEAKQVELVVKAKDAGIATTRICIEKLRSVFDVKDIDAYLTELEEEKTEAMRQQQEAAAEMMALTTPSPDDADEDEDAGQEAKSGARARFPRGAATGTA